MRFLPYDQARSVPNVIVDGARNEGTVLTLSHWPKSGTLTQLKGDTSTAIVFNYLDRPQFRVEADVVSNNHFDEDGSAGIFALLEPAMAERHRELIVDVAQAGDFGIFARRQAARIAFTLSAYADPDVSPLPSALFKLPYSEMASELYIRLIEVLPNLITNLDDYRALWETEDARLTASEEFIESGLITIDEQASVAQSVVMMNFTARAELQWRFILRAIALADSDEALGHIAAGPFEHLLGWHGEKFIAEIEQRAAIDPKLARTLTGVRQYTMSDSVWARVQSLQSEVPNPLAQDDVD
jgi:hypothetical protein